MRTLPPQLVVDILDYLGLPPGWSMRVECRRSGFVDLRIHNDRNFFRRTIRVPEHLVTVPRDDARDLISHMERQLVAQMLRVAGDERMESPIVVGPSPSQIDYW